MGYGDNRYGDDRSGGGGDRWQTPDRNDQWGRERGQSGQSGWSGGEQGRGNRGGGGSRGGGGEDRGFFERAGEQVRSWFSDDDDRARGGGGNYGRERSGGSGGDWNRGSESFGGGFGNQRGWGDDHFERGSQGGLFGGGNREGGSGGGGFFGGGREGGSGGNRSEDYAQGSSRSNWGGGGGGADTWGGSGFGGPDDNGRRFDRIDPGHVGAQGAHPMSSPVDAGYGASAGGYARSAAIMAGGQHGIDPEARDRMLGRSGGGQSSGQSVGGQGFGGSGQGFGGGSQSGGQSFAGGGQGFAGRTGDQSFGRGQSGGGWGGQHDPHYSEWRQRQIEELDRDYDEYRREHQSKFEQEFGGWRSKRQGQRQSLGRVSEHMTVVGSDGEHIGTVDKVSGDRIILTKSDPNAGGVHHSIPCSWIEKVEDQVTVNKTAAEAMRQWESEEQNRALFERGDEGSEGPHALNRSFSGTYSDDK